MEFLISTSFILILATLIQVCPAPFIPAIIAAAEGIAEAAVAAGIEVASAVGADAAAISADITSWAAVDAEAVSNFEADIAAGNYEAAVTDIRAAAERGSISEADAAKIEADLAAGGSRPIDHHYKRSKYLALLARATPTKEELAACWKEMLNKAPQVVVHNSTSITLTDLHECWTQAINSASA